MIRNSTRMGRPCRSAGHTLLVLVLSLALASCAGERADPSGFNVLLLTLDTTRADHLGAYGGEHVPTPNLDRIAREGVRFDDAVSQVPLTLPSHASLLTGLYPAAHGVRHNGLFRLTDDHATLAEHLKTQGFQTAAFVGAFVLNRGFGLAQGFDTYDDIPLEQARKVSDPLNDAQRTADEVNEAFFGWLRRRPEGRFFAWLHYYDPHAPYRPPEVPGRRLEGQGYAREISYVDACVGDLLRRLEAEGLLDRTLLIVAADHGESLGEHREKTHGVFLYESVMRVPWMMRAPGLVPAGLVVDGPVELVDLPATVLDLLSLPAMHGVQGRSLVPWIRAGRAPEAALAFAETLMPRIEFGWAELRMARDRRYKFIEAPRPELYDLVRDPAELQNLFQDDPERARSLQEALDAWKRNTESPEAQAAAARSLSPEEEERLRSLGYLGGDFFKRDGEGGSGLDPKDGIEESLQVEAAKAKLHQGMVEEAVAELRAVLGRNPGNHLARGALVEGLMRLGHLKEAEEEALAALAAAVQDPYASAGLELQARMKLAAIYRSMGRTEQAQRQLAAVEELKGRAVELPRAPEGREAGGGPSQEAAALQEALRSGDPDRIEAVAAGFSPRGAVELGLLVGAARALLQAGRVGPAVAALERAREAAPQDPDVLGYLASAYLRQQRLAEAEALFLEIQSLRPEDPRPDLYLGNIALLRGDEAAARRHYEAALSKDPKWTEPLRNLALWLAQQGRAREARATLEDALRRNPGDEQARQLLQQLGRG